MRIQLDLDQSGRELVDRLEEITGCKTHTEFFNSAVTLFEWAVQQRTKGRIIASLDESNMNYKELQMPALERAARPAASAMASASHAAKE